VSDYEHSKNPTKCAKCGACTVVCPVYRVSGDEAVSPRGRLHLLASLTSLKKSARGVEILSKCLLCGACYQACPRSINIPEIVIRARESGRLVRGLGDFKKFIGQRALSAPGALTVVRESARLLDAILPAESGLRLRLIPLLGEREGSSKGVAVTLKVSSSNTTPRIAYFMGCLANHLQPEIALASIHLLQGLAGYTTTTPKEQRCCGMASGAAGDRPTAIKLAQENIRAFSAPPFADLKIFTSCATCCSRLRNYPSLFIDDPKWHKRAQDFSSRVVEFSTFLQTTANLRSPKRHPKKAQARLRVIYHDPCHLRFPCDNSPPIISEPRALIASLPGIELIEPPQGPRCCGQGGLFNIAHPATSQKLADSFISPFLQMHPDIITTTCSGCLTQIRQALIRHQSTVKAVHLARLVEQSLVSLPSPTP